MTPDIWTTFEAKLRGELREAVIVGEPLVLARAPGRLDVMGGIADYSGSVVLESTIREGTYCAVQRVSEPRLRVRSTATSTRTYECPLSIFTGAGGLETFEGVAEHLKGEWAGYVVGCVYVLLAAGWLSEEDLSGLNFSLDSQVPIGAGLSSSAAIEVAAMTALLGLLGIKMDGAEIARLCQIVENRIVGAPCGIMDQMTSALGREGSLLAMKCQPAEIIGLPLAPKGWRFVGIDSGVRHSVGGDSYRSARIGAFMGLGLLQHESGCDWDGYLCNMSPDIWSGWSQRVPEEMSGTEFLVQYGSLPDTVTRIDPSQVYRVRACTEHPILENDRVREFLALMGMAGEEADAQLMIEAGGLMLASHRSYSDRVLLGSPETDLLVQLAMERGSKEGIYGAKITGGGSGGTVAILTGGEPASDALRWVQSEYESRTGLAARLVECGSPGAVQAGTKTIVV